VDVCAVHVALNVCVCYICGATVQRSVAGAASAAAPKFTSQAQAHADLVAKVDALTLTVKTLMESQAAAGPSARRSSGASDMHHQHAEKLARQNTENEHKALMKEMETKEATWGAQTKAEKLLFEALSAQKLAERETEARDKELVLMREHAAKQKKTSKRVKGKKPEKKRRKKASSESSSGSSSADSGSSSGSASATCSEEDTRVPSSDRKKHRKKDRRYSGGSAKKDKKDKKDKKGKRVPSDDE
jgi:hypothetical protein